MKNYTPTSSAQLSFTPINDTYSAALVHVTTFSSTVGILLEFSDPIDCALGQAGSIPKFGSTSETFNMPYDPIGRIPMQQYDSSSFIITATAVQTGVMTSDFYAILFVNSTAPATITATATYITPTTANYSTVTHESSFVVPNAVLPQIVRIPFSEDLQVVRASFDFDGNFSQDCVVDNFTQVPSCFIFFVLFVNLVTSVSCLEPVVFN
jgi:hypothetical protein